MNRSCLSEEFLSKCLIIIICCRDEGEMKKEMEREEEEEEMNKLEMLFIENNDKF